MKSSIVLAAGIIDRMEAVARGYGTRFWRRVLADCAAMKRALAPYERAALWSSVGRMTHLPAASTVLQQRRGYRDVYRHYLRLRSTTRLPLRRRALLDLLEAKDIAQLYELWCYFQVVDAVSSVTGTKPVRADSYAFSDTQVGLRWDFRVQWPGKLRCYYNLRFSRSRPGGRRSYSVPLRPDIVLDHPAAGRHAFDAKFRLVRKEDGRATFKRADLYKMHAYRDALPLRSARILYPGTEAAFFEVPGERGEGVGAVPLVPVGDGGELGRVIAALL